MLWAIRWLTAAAVCLAMSANARAFFFKGWPGEGRAKPESLLKPGTPDVTGQPPGDVDEPNPGGETNPPGGGPVVPGVPEPGTVVLACLGIGAVAFTRRLRRTRPQ